MQTFEPNDAMANFLTMEDAASFYDKVMVVWQHYEQHLALSVHRVRYEEVVTDFEGAVRPLLDYLDLPWNDSVSSFQDTALKRGQIRTPSYHQVVQPIYQRASGRWMNYKVQMEGVLAKLQPWVERFGYNNDNL